MIGLNKAVGENEKTVISAATSFPNPPTSVAVVAAEWNSVDGVVPEFDVSLWAAGAAVFSDLELVGGVLRPRALADDAVTAVSTANDTIDLTTGGIYTGEGPFRLTTTDTLPAGLETGTDYWAIRVDADTIKLATSLANAFAGEAVDITDTGTGTHTLVDTPDTELVIFESMGLLGNDNDGAVTLAAREGYRARAFHHPKIVCYGLIAPSSTPANGVSAVVAAVLEG